MRSIIFPVSPVCLEHSQKKYLASDKEPINITCQVESDPPVSAFQWKFNGSGDSMTIPSKSIVSQGMVSVLEFVPFSEQDYGQLLCWAANSVGTQRSPCVFDVDRTGQLLQAYLRFVMTQICTVMSIDGHAAHDERPTQGDNNGTYTVYEN